MTTLLFESRFVPAIESGRKVHSIRQRRIHPIRPGDPLSLRQWREKAYRSPQRTILDTTCLAVMTCWIWSDHVCISRSIGDCDFLFETPAELDAFAVSDGFDNWEQMRTYRDWHYALPFKGQLILWGVHPMLSLEPKR